MTLYRPRQRSGAPQGPYRLDRANPRNRGTQAFLPLEGTQRLVNLGTAASDEQVSFAASRPSWRPSAHDIWVPDFNGSTDQHVTFGTRQYLTSTQPFTIAFWSDFDGFGSQSFRYIWQLKNTDDAANFVGFFSNFSGYTSLAFGNGVTWPSLRFNIPTADVVGLHFWVLTGDGAGLGANTNIRGYRDNVQVTISGGSNLVSLTDPNLIGARVGTTSLMDGAVYWFQVLNREWSERERTAAWQPQTRWNNVIPLREQFDDFQRIGDTGVVPPTGFKPWYATHANVGAGRVHSV